MFEKSYYLLQKEAYLIHSCLAKGLTDFKKANLGSLGLYYTGLFQLTIGIERLTKIIFIVNYMKFNNLKLPNKILEGHKISELVNECINISKHNKYDQEIFNYGEIKLDIINLLTAFAEKTRYENINKLINKPRGEEPLAAWGKILNKIYIQIIPEKNKNNIKSNNNFNEETSLKSLVFMSDLNDQIINNYNVMMENYEIYSLSSSYAICEIIEIIFSLVSVIYKLGDDVYYMNTSSEKCVIPYMSDFFQFICIDKKHN